MFVERRPSSLETSSLLGEAPPSYNATDDVNCPPPSPTSTISEETSSPPLNKFSKAHICWMLVGLWSGVFLGAFDGVFPSLHLPSKGKFIHPRVGTVVATLLTPIGSEFKASNQSSYIGTSYLLSVCCFTPLYGVLLQDPCNTSRFESRRMDHVADLLFRTTVRYSW